MASHLSSLALLSLLMSLVSSEVVLEDGYTVTTAIDGHKLKINPYSVIASPGSSDLFVLDSSSSVFYTLSLPLSQESVVKRLSGDGAGFSDGEPGSARFDQPKSFAVDMKGNVYVADQKNNVIRKITNSGVTTIAGGLSKKVGHLDGPGQNASFSTSFELTFVPQICALLISDHGNQLIRQINLKPEDCARNSPSGPALGTVSVWVLGLILSCLLGLVIGFFARPYITRHTGRPIHGDEAAVILQTNRGNLECIYPRKLVLTSIVNALIQERYRDALVMVRRHRIEFNIIVDHCGWQAFLQSASEFVRQVNNLSYITEFVCAIKNENITETLYKKFEFLSLPCRKEYKDVQAKEFKSSDANKVSSVLLAIRKALEEQVPESPAREVCILTTLARSDPPALEEALERIKVIRETELLGSDDPRRMSYPSSEEALKHLLWLSDSEAVYEAALGLYDLNLAAIVALNSQRDPKEFLPYLQELERMPTLLMRYTIDLRLRRYENALKHIVSMGDFYYADCLNLMKKYPQLFPLGLKLITDPAKRGQVLEAWADHLSDEKCFEDAAAAYLCCSSLEKAMKAYRDSGNWSGVLTVAGLLKLGKDEVMKLANELCEELHALGKPGEAAKIALDYCGDVNYGISLLIDARDWEEALRVAFMHRREDLITEVKNASLECASSVIGEYKEGVEKVGKYLTRYLAVRQRRLLLAAKLQSEDRSMNDLDDDTVSETSSNFSGMSVYTTGTRKGSAASTTSTAASRARDARRQRNKGKIRPGSPGEELALVDHLKGMSLTAGAKHELKSLLVSLVMLGEEETARKLQNTGENFQLSQMAAFKLAEDTMSTDIINEHAHNLERYMQTVKRELQNSEAFSWRSQVFLSP